MVLVSDGIETCVADPCAVAAELKKAGVGFVAHVIGFDVADPAAKAQLQCIARATGGVYLDARDASGLENALGRAVDATQGGRVQSEAPARPVEDPYRGKNIRGVARLAAGLDPITDLELGWLVHKPAGAEKGEYLTRFDGSPFAGEIAPGDYVVEVEYGLVKRQRAGARSSAASRRVLDVALDAGYVTSEGAVQGGGSKVDDVSWEVLDRNGNWLATEYRSLPRFVLQAGDYTLRLKRGLSTTEKSFSVAAGDAINVAMTIDAGKLLVSGVYAPGGPKIENGFAVEIRKAPAERGRGRRVGRDQLRGAVAVRTSERQLRCRRDRRLCQARHARGGAFGRADPDRGQSRCRHRQRQNRQRQGDRDLRCRARHTSANTSRRRTIRRSPSR